MKTLFTEAELLHYQRHFNLAAIGVNGQQRLKQAKVLYIGAGGLGSSALLYLAAAGVGTLGVVDFDRVEASNLQRQVLYSYDELGHSKVLAATARLKKLNPAIDVIAHELQLSAENAAEIIAQYDVIADGSDNFTTRYLVNDVCSKLNKPHVYASIAQFTGQCTVFTSENGPCYRCLFPTPPPAEFVPNCAEGGVLGVLPGVMGSIQATEVIKLIVQMGKSLINRLLIFNALDMQFRELRLERNPDCQLCRFKPFAQSVKKEESNEIDISVTELREWQENKIPFCLLDVREPDEYEKNNLGGKNIPLMMLKECLHELNKNDCIVVHCERGSRSQQAVALLLANGFMRVRNLLGGISAWK